MQFFDIKNKEFRDLQDNLKKLKKEIEQIEIKIQNDGIEGYYSVNSDLLEYAQKVFISMRVLGHIKNFSRRTNE
jgi:hypothetical protein